MRDLLIATGNAHKLIEIRHALEGLPFNVLGIKDMYPEGIEIAEPGETLEGNAIIKAMTLGKRTGKLTLADDSGLEVDALNGEPGVKTARYVEGTDEDRYRHLLEKMDSVPDAARGAQYRSVIAIYDPEHYDKVRIATGICRGMIERGPVLTESHSFGYDPVFRIEQTGKMMSETGVEERMSDVSHRGKALKRAREILAAEFA